MVIFNSFLYVYQRVSNHFHGDSTIHGLFTKIQKKGDSLETNIR